jgi:membrane-associated phospholipid phosphatase
MCAMQTVPSESSVPRQARRTWSLSLVMMLAGLVAALPAHVSAASQDPVLEWIKITNDQIIAAGTTPLVSARQVTMVASAVFDAANGIDPRFESIHVKARGPRHGSPRAAAIQAAYGILVRLYSTPAQVAALTAQRDASIAALSAGPGAERAQAIAAGVAWGQSVAEDIWAWRATDGFNPNPAPAFLGSLGRPVAGVWRPSARTDAAPGTPGAPGAGPQFATMTPWVIRRASQFRPAAPYASPLTGQVDLTSAAYLADYQETKLMGAYAGPRTADQSELALFWAGNTTLFWNRIAIQASTARHLTFAENVHLFALLNLAIGDAAIICWDAKYRYVLWRPITAVREGNVDPDPTWRPWIESFPATSSSGVTPAHPEFPSGHSTLSGAAVAILADAFGDSTPFTVDSEVRPGTRAFPSFSAALAEIHDARVFAGIHWRTACRVGSAMGEAMAAYVSSHALRERDGNDRDERR